MGVGGDGQRVESHPVAGSIKEGWAEGCSHLPSVLWKKPAPQVEEEIGGDDVVQMSLCNQGGYF